MLITQRFIMLIFILWVIVLILAVWLHFRQVYSYFEKHGVKNIPPVLLLGNMTKTIFRRQHFADHVRELYNEFPNEKFYGRYEFTSPLIVIRDLDLIKKITIKDFDYFIDHRSTFSNSNSFFSRNLLSLKGQEWRDMRSTLSPAFTSSKMRLMVPFMTEVGDQMSRALKKKIKDSNAGYLDVDCKDLTTRYANDVIASCAFGLKVDSHNDENNQFYVTGRSATSFNFRQSLIFFILNNAPSLAKIFNLDFFSEETKKFFRTLVLDTMKERELRNIVRPDMIHLLMEAKKGKLNHEDIASDDIAAGFATVEESSVGTKAHNRVWTDDDIIAQAVLFLVAGFDTVSSASVFLLHELAVHADVQDKLYKEIKEQDERNKGKFDFNSVQNMTYMDMVVSELLRRWTPGIFLDRVCTKDYNLGKPNEKADKDFIIRKGSGLNIPVAAIHHDPNYFSNPEKFDPERFSEENRHKINPAAYMPFGVGPRNCIASRFALCELKVMTYQILQHFVLSPCKKTCIPAELAPDSFNMRMKGGHWLKFEIRK